MDEAISVIYYSLQGEERLCSQPITEEKIAAEEIKVLPISKCAFTLKKEPGFYEYGTCTWLIEKEGLYRFSGGEEDQRQHIYYKEDVPNLIAAVSRCCEYSGETTINLKDNLIFSKIYARKETGAKTSEILGNLLYNLAVPYRIVYFYAPQAKCSVFEWLEIWDEKKKSWTLYWPDSNFFLGCTSLQRTVFDVFAGLKNGQFDHLERFLPFQEYKNNLLAAKGLLADLNKAMADAQNLPKLIEEKKLVPLISSDGAYMLNLYTPETNKVKFQSDNNFDNFDVSGKSELYHKVEFFKEEYLQKEVYCPQLFIMSAKAVKTF